MLVSNTLAIVSKTFGTIYIAHTKIKINYVEQNLKI